MRSRSFLGLEKVRSRSDHSMGLRIFQLGAQQGRGEGALVLLYRCWMRREKKDAWGRQLAGCNSSETRPSPTLPSSEGIAEISMSIWS